MTLAFFGLRSVSGLFGLVVLVLDVMAIVGLLRGNASTVHKALWIALVLLFPVVGVAAYYLIGRNSLDR